MSGGDGLYVLGRIKLDRPELPIILLSTYDNPTYVAREDVPATVLEKEREIYRSQMADQKKPAQVLDKIVEGKLEKFFSEQCLLEQPFIKDATGKTRVKDLVDQVNAATKEKVFVRRFARFQVGGGG